MKTEKELNESLVEVVRQIEPLMGARTGEKAVLLKELRKQQKEIQQALYDLPV